MSEPVTTHQYTPVRGVEDESAAAEGPRTDAPRRPRSALKRVLKVVLPLVTITAVLYAVWKYPAESRTAWEAVASRVWTQKAHVPPKPAKLLESAGPWDGSLVLSEHAQKALGLVTVKVHPQSEPIRLELLGTTANIAETLTKVRLMFKGRVDKVHVAVGEAVKKGDPLIDLYSKDLAEAKRAYDIELMQWTYDKKLLETREPLVKLQDISKQLYEETKNNEMKSRREFEVARDRLYVFGLSQQEVERVESEAGAEKARMTIRSPSDGYVIERDAAPGNLYDEGDILLIISPLDRLWVWGNVFESDLDLVKIGQSWLIRFPFLEQKILGKVEYVSNRVDPNTHAVRIRTSIPNPEGRLKSDMLVRGMLEIPPVPGRTVVPRTSLIVDDGHFYVFVKVPNEPGGFMRRTVTIAQEKDDHAVIEDGLKAGDDVVSVGALILAQIYENRKTAQTGAPAASGGPSVD
jgi:cobalt-zinc-cadmium efflux system membrane fusion protein